MLFPIHFESDGICLLYSNRMVYSSKSDWWCFFWKKSFDIYFIFNFRSTYLTKNHQWLNRDSFRLSWDFLDQQLLIAINRNCYWPTKSQLNQKTFQQIKRYSNFAMWSKKKFLDEKTEFTTVWNGIASSTKVRSIQKTGVQMLNKFMASQCVVSLHEKWKKKLSQSVTNVKQEHLSLLACMCMRTCSFEPKLIAHLFDTRFKHFSPFFIYVVLVFFLFDGVFLK